MKNKQHTIEFVKRLAKKAKKELGISHTDALNKISKDHGYANWISYYRVLNQLSVERTRVSAPKFEISYSEWLGRHKNRNSPLGDLASDMLKDRRWPQNGNLEIYKNHLLFLNAVPEAIATLKKSWSTYLAYVKRKNTVVTENLKSSKIKTKMNDPRNIVFIKNAKAIPFADRTVEKFEAQDKAWISWNGRKAIPVTVLEVDERNYSVRIERPLTKAGGSNSLFLDEVRSTPTLACMNHVTW